MHDEKVLPIHLVSQFTTKGIMHDESPGDERHWPIDKGEISFLTDLKDNVRDSRVRIRRNNES